MRILILSASVGSGHMRAAQALGAALRETAPQVETRLVDVLDHAHPAFKSLYGGGYLKLASRAPHLVGYLFDRLDQPGARGDAVRLRLQRLFLGGLERLLLEERWDLAVSTHFLPAEILAHLRRRGKLSLPQAVAVTDFDAHRIWMHEPCERYFAASDEAAAALRHFGVDAGRISVTGIPIHPRFAARSRASAARRAMNLAADRPVILLLGGGCGMGPMERLFEALDEVSSPIQIVAVAGRNETLRRRLSRRALASKQKARVLGYTDRIDELMRASDLIVTKPGGLTVSEALACGVPLAIVDPIPGQESRNGDFALEHGAAIKIQRPSALTHKVELLLATPERLEQLKASARRLGRPVAAFDAARECLALAGARVPA